MDYSLHYDDELTITGTFSPTTPETQAFEFLEFFKEHARIDPLLGCLTIRWCNENGNGYAWSGGVWLNGNNHLRGHTTTHFIGSFDPTPFDHFHPSLIQQITREFKTFLETK